MNETLTLIMKVIMKLIMTVTNLFRHIILLLNGHILFESIHGQSNYLLGRERLPYEARIPLMGEKYNY